MVRSFVFLFAFALLATPSVAFNSKISPSDLSLEEVIARHTKAVGGKRAIERIQRMRIVATISEPQFTADVNFWLTRPAGIRADVVFNDGLAITEASDGRVVWNRRGNGKPSLSSKAGAEAFMHGAEFPGFLRGLHELRGRGHRVTLLGREEIEAQQHYVLEVTLTDGFRARFYIDARTFLITRKRSEHALHPDINPKKQVIEARWSDFRRVGGVIRPFRSVDVDLETGQQLSEMIIKKIEINIHVPPKFFSMPESP